MNAMDRAAEARMLAYQAEAQLARQIAAAIANSSRRLVARISEILGHSSTANRYPSL